MAVEKKVLYSKEGNVAVATFNMPELRNPITQIGDELKEAMEEARKDGEVRVLVLTGAGSAFSSGGNIAGMVERAETKGKRSVWKQTFQPHENLYFRLLNYEKPLLAAINGPAIGAGLLAALWCDMRIASEKASFGAFWVKRGLDPAPSCPYILTKIVGLPNALEMMYTGKLVEAQEAFRIGLANKVVPHDQLMRATMELAQHIAKMPPVAVQMTRRQTYRSLEMGVLGAMDMQSPQHLIAEMTEDHEEGTRAFLQKREPVYKGR